MRIVVTGDVCVDVVGLATGPPKEGSSQSRVHWRMEGEKQIHYLRGGAWLLADMMREAVSSTHEVIGPRVGAPTALLCGEKEAELTTDMLPRLTTRELVHSLIEVDLFIESHALSDAKPAPPRNSCRVRRVHGFSGPSADTDPVLQPAKPPADPGPTLLVLDDTGNLVRSRKDQWPDEIQAGLPAGSAVLLKLHRPLPTIGEDGGRNSSPLWEALRHHANATAVVLVMDDLRAHGAHISAGLSWELTALDFVRELAGRESLALLSECRWLIVRCGLEGALCWHRPADGKDPHVWLIYDPLQIEGGFSSGVPGSMVGYGSAFVAAIGAAVADAGGPLPPAATVLPPALGYGIRDGLNAARRLLIGGFAREAGRLSYPKVASGGPASLKRAIYADIEIPLPKSVANPDGEHWSILKRLLPGGNELERTAGSLATTGKPTPTLAQVPLGEFGALSTYDRREIEAYRAISRLIRSYLENLNPERPLCFAVFGPPGSGKSFGVKQVAKAVATGRASIEERVFNLAQFRDPAELGQALHLVRDDVIRGKVPLVFFDEFDATVDDVRLYWLRFVLAPMQDGTFLEQGVDHPIGKAIFVFAGGTATSYTAFLRLGLPRERDEPESSAESPAGAASRSESNSAAGQASETFRAAKGPDFVSRLRGILDIPGIDHGGEFRGSVLLRRAGVLRFQVKKKAPGLLDGGGRLQIDPGVLRAFLNVRRFEHGMRSLESLLDMSMLAGRPIFDPGCLPSAGQMLLHVRPCATEAAPGLGFMDLVARESPFNRDIREKIAEQIHRNYLPPVEKRIQGKPSHVEWEKLSEVFKDSNRTQADDIPRKLRLLGFDWIARKTAGTRKIIDRFADENGNYADEDLREQIDKAARLEHDRWLAERRALGWSYGEKEDGDRLVSPAMLPWHRLADGEKKKDLDAILSIPAALAAAGLVLFDPRKS